MSYFSDNNFLNLSLQSGRMPRCGLVGKYIHGSSLWSMDGALMV